MHIAVNNTVTNTYIYQIAFDFTVDGGWSDWLIGNCSVSCVKERTRSCNNPEPSCGGKKCSGLSIETMKCNELPCEGLLYIANYSYVGTVATVQKTLKEKMFDKLNKVLTIFNC